MLTIIQRLIAWLVRTDATSIANGVASTTDTLPWHGDHWQNVLSSPMDARHYVMEDWSLLPEPDVAAGGVVGLH